MTKPVETDFVVPASRESEQHALSVLIASELTALGFPAQRFDIQASFLTFDPTDLGIRLVWPVSIRFQGKPTGVIQIGTSQKTWLPETRAIITFARLMEPERLRKEVHDWCLVMAAQVRDALEKRGGEWPEGWPRIRAHNGGVVNDMATKPGNIRTMGKLRKRI